MATSARTELPSAPKGAFPPFQRETFASQAIWLAVSFVILYALVARLALPRIGAIIENRRSRIAADIAEAQRFKDESDAAIAAYEKALADARARAQALANDMRLKQIAAADAARKALETRLDARLAEAERTIAATRTAAMANVRAIASDAASAIVERLTGAAPADSEIAAAMSEVIKS